MLEPPKVKKLRVIQRVDDSAAAADMTRNPGQPPKDLLHMILISGQGTMRNPSAVAAAADAVGTTKTKNCGPNETLTVAVAEWRDVDPRTKTANDRMNRKRSNSMDWPETKTIKCKWRETRW